MNTLPRVSVIVPCYNAEENIAILVESLLNLDYPKELLEIIIVDNNSNDQTKEIIKQYPVRLLEEMNIQSSYAARNLGIKNAKGDVIAFTDSDCIPSSNWIKKGVENLLRVTNCGLVAGRIDIFFKNPNKPTAVELYESIAAFPQKFYVEVQKFGATANVFTFRNVINHVGIFNDKLKSSGDFEWGNRVYSFGYKLVYADDTSVTHPARYSFRQLYNKHVRVIGGHYNLKKRDYTIIPFIRFLFRDLLPPKVAIMQFFNDRRLKEPIRKCKVIFVVLFLRIIWIWERIRLRLERTSKRGV